MALARLKPKNADNYAEYGRLAALQATKAASGGARMAMHEPADGYESAEKSEDKPTPNSTVTVVQIVGFLWIMFDLKSLVAYFLMTTAA